MLPLQTVDLIYLVCYPLPKAQTSLLVLSRGQAPFVHPLPSSTHIKKRTR